MASNLPAGRAPLPALPRHERDAWMSCLLSLRVVPIFPLLLPEVTGVAMGEMEVIIPVTTCWIEVAGYPYIPMWGTEAEGVPIRRNPGISIDSWIVRVFDSLELPCIGIVVEPVIHGLGRLLRPADHVAGPS